MAACVATERDSGLGSLFCFVAKEHQFGKKRKPDDFLLVVFFARYNDGIDWINRLRQYWVDMLGHIEDQFENSV